MSQELEIKLSLAGNDQEVAVQWLLGLAGASDEGCRTLTNRYYDTPSGDLNRQKVALRVRKSGEGFIQTLKTRGEFVEGAHRRHEWEWPIADNRLDLALLADTPLAGSGVLGELLPVFETNFERRIVMIVAQDAVIECAVDCGEIVAGGQHRPLHEVEFELKSGNPGRLLELARKLAEVVPVFLNLVSKAEQGYYVAGLYRPALGRAVEISTITGFLYGLSVAWLTGQALAVGAEGLAWAAGAAAAEGVSELWAQLEPELAGGVTVEALMTRGTLGRFQLAIAAH